MNDLELPAHENDAYDSPPDENAEAWLLNLSITILRPSKRSRIKTQQTMT